MAIDFQPFQVPETEVLAYVNCMDRAYGKTLQTKQPLIFTMF